MATLSRPPKKVLLTLLGCAQWAGLMLVIYAYGLPYARFVVQPAGQSRIASEDTVITNLTNNTNTTQVALHMTSSSGYDPATLEITTANPATTKKFLEQIPNTKGPLPTYKYPVSQPIGDFLSMYTGICETTTLRLPRPPTDVMPVCKCVPSTLVGYSHADLSSPPELPTLERLHYDLRPGGHWAPSDCISRQRTVLIVPFRDRLTHLRLFLRHILPFLKRQKQEFRIVIVEQKAGGVFNKAMMMNAGFLEARKLYNDTDCYIFHDVDMLPEEDRNFYTCDSSPRHVGAYADKFHYDLFYLEMFGGAVAMREEDMVEVNGYSNEFFGWGGEDDDMNSRLLAAKIDIVRFPKCVARYKMIKHARDSGNPVNKKGAGLGWQSRPQLYKINGLTSIKYKVLKGELLKLFTWFVIEPENQLTVQQFMAKARGGTS